MQQQNDTRLRHAYVGVGAGIFGAHRRAIDASGVEVVGVSDVNRAAAEARAEELGCPAFTDHREMLARTRPDVVVITTPHPFHAQVAISAFEAGCHVLTEKPMA